MFERIPQHRILKGEKSYDFEEDRAAELLTLLMMSADLLLIRDDGWSEPHAIDNTYR